MGFSCGVENRGKLILTKLILNKNYYNLHYVQTTHHQLQISKYLKKAYANTFKKALTHNISFDLINVR